jgi:hypothetical protein
MNNLIQHPLINNRIRHSFPLSSWQGLVEGAVTSQSLSLPACRPDSLLKEPLFHANGKTLIYSINTFPFFNREMNVACVSDECKHFF